MTDLVPLSVIRQHPMNPRRDATADDGLVTSIASAGVLSPVTLAPHPTETDAFILIAGHRRIDAAARAGLTGVPALVRDDLITEVQQVEAMLIENLRRADLTPVEEAAGYEQLELFGMDADAIAAATGTKPKTVRERLKLKDLGESARERLHAGQVQIGDVMSLLEFRDLPELAAELEESLGTPSFRWKLTAAREGRDRAARNTDLIRGWDEKGIAPFTGAFHRYDLGEGPWPLQWWTDDDAALSSVHAHEECLAYVSNGVTSHQPPLLVCTRPAGHMGVSAGRPNLVVVTDAEAEQEQNRAADVASRVDAEVQARLEFLTEHLAAMLPPRGNEHLVAALTHALPALIEADMVPLAATNLPPRDNGDLAAEAGNPNTAPARRLDVLAMLLAGGIEHRLSIDHDPAAWAWLRAAGWETGEEAAR